MFLPTPPSNPWAALKRPIRNRINKLLANGLIEFFINSSPVFNNEPRGLPTNYPDCIVLNNWVFDSLISVNELFAKPLRRFATCLFVNKNSR